MRKISVGLAVSLIVTACGGGGGGSSNTATTATTQSAKLPVITLTLSKTEINVTQSTTLNWAATDATSCNASNAWSGSQSLSGSRIVSYIEGSQTFELSCTGSGGTTSKSVTLSGKQPTLTFAGAWYPVANESLKDGYEGAVVGSFYNHIKIGSQSRYGLAVTGWGFKGWDSKSNETAIVKVGLFEPDSNGLLTLTNKYITDPTTYGGASVIVTNVDNDQYQDIVLVSHNETPILPKPTTVFYGSQSGNFSKRISSDKLAAHDAQLVSINGKQRIFTSVVTGHPRNAYYEMVNGDLNPTYVPTISYYNNNFSTFGNMSQAVVENKNGNKVLVTAGGCRSSIGSCERTINIFPFDGNDISQSYPSQSITPYLSTLPRFTNVVSADGQGQTHVYRVWSMDVNNDGNKDVLAAQSMWNSNTNSFPVALQVLQNSGSNVFVDKTDSLATDITNDGSNIDPSPSFIDIDNTGIPAMFFTVMTFQNTDKHSNYVVLNDGTGKFHVALHDEFTTVSDNIFKLLVTKGYKFPVSNPNKSWMLPKFIVVPQSDGTLNFLAEVKTTSQNPDTGVTQVTHLFVNVPFSYNPTNDFTKNISVSDRNNSKKIRTWAGDDTISDQNAVTGTKIDGGLGKNKVTYSSSSTNYSVTKNNDGSYRVTNTANNIDDTLVRIHNIVFTDKTITLE